MRYYFVEKLWKITATDMARKKNIYEPKETYTNIYGTERKFSIPDIKTQSWNIRSLKWRNIL